MCITARCRFNRFFLPKGATCRFRTRLILGCVLRDQLFLTVPLSFVCFVCFVVEGPVLFTVSNTRILYPCPLVFLNGGYVCRKAISDPPSPPRCVTAEPLLPSPSPSSCPSPTFRLRSSSSLSDLTHGGDGHHADPHNMFPFGSRSGANDDEQDDGRIHIHQVRLGHTQTKRGFLSRRPPTTYKAKHKVSSFETVRWVTSVYYCTATTVSRGACGVWRRCVACDGKQERSGMPYLPPCRRNARPATKLNTVFSCLGNPKTQCLSMVGPPPLTLLPYPSCIDAARL